MKTSKKKTKANGAKICFTHDREQCLYHPSYVDRRNSNSKWLRARKSHIAQMGQASTLMQFSTMKSMYSMEICIG